MRQFTLTDILTRGELRRARKLYGKADPGTFTRRCASEIIQPRLERIEKTLGQTLLRIRFPNGGRVMSPADPEDWIQEVARAASLWRNDDDHQTPSLRAERRGRSRSPASAPRRWHLTEANSCCL